MEVFPDMCGSTGIRSVLRQACKPLAVSECYVIKCRNYKHKCFMSRQVGFGTRRGSQLQFLYSFCGSGHEEAEDRDYLGSAHGADGAGRLQPWPASWRGRCLRGARKALWPSSNLACAHQRAQHEADLQQNFAICSRPHCWLLKFSSLLCSLSVRDATTLDSVRLVLQTFT